jgi:hypothetical protein
LPTEPFSKERTILILSSLTATAWPIWAEATETIGLPAHLFADGVVLPPGQDNARVGPLFRGQPNELGTVPGQGTQT